MPARARLHPATRNLLAARFVRSLAQGGLLVGFALYLDRLGWTGGEIGSLLGAGMLGGGLLGLLVGVTTDRFGRKQFLLVYQAAVAIVSLVLVFTESPVWILAGTLIAGFGRGQAGAAGPFAPAEGAWLAEAVRPESRGVVYSLNAALGFFGMATGALAAGAIPFVQRWLPGAAAYRVLFALSVASALVVLVLLSVTPGGGGHAPKKPDAEIEREAREAAREVRRGENRAMVLLAITNAFNGLGIGLVGPLIAYWFDIRFGVGPGAIGPVFFVTFLLTAVASLVTGALTRRFGLVRSVVAGRGIGVGLLVTLPLAPTYVLAAAIYAVRSAASRGTIGARMAMAVSLVGDARRGLATSLNTVSFILPATIGPVIGGYLLEAGHLELPFFIGAALQLVYLVLYAWIFRRYEPARG